MGVAGVPSPAAAVVALIGAAGLLSGRLSPLAVVDASAAAMAIVAAVG